MRLHRLLEGYHAERKETRSFILQQFLLWSETKQNQKWSVIPAKAASYSHHSNNSSNPIPSACHSEVNGTRLLLQFLPLLTRQLRQWNEFRLIRSCYA